MNQLERVGNYRPPRLYERDSLLPIFQAPNGLDPAGGAGLGVLIEFGSKWIDSRKATPVCRRDLCAVETALLFLLAPFMVMQTAAAFYTEFGGIDKLQVGFLDLPEIGESDVLLRVKAARLMFLNAGAAMRGVALSSRMAAF